MRHSPFSILRRHFFRRLFQNDLINLEDQMKEKVIAGLAVLSVLCGFFAYAHISKYLLLPGMEGSWRETTVYLHFLMVIMGFATVLEWEVLIPDSRDAANLIPLPLRVRTLFAAKFASLLLFAGGLALGMNALGVLVFTFYLPASHSNSLVFSLRYACSITVAGLAACLAVFFSVIFLIGLMMWLCGPRLYHRVSHLLRTLILMGFVVQMVLFFTGAVPFMGSLLDLGAGGPETTLPKGFPPLWFAGLVQKLLGDPDPRFGSLSARALTALVLPAIGFMIVSLLGYRAQLRKRPERARVSPRRGGLFARLRDIFSALALRNPVRHAIYDFFSITLRRSLPHRMQILTYGSVAAGLACVILAYSLSSGLDLHQINRSLLAVPLLVALVMLLGSKNTAAIPVSLKANWIFRLTEGGKTSAYTDGLKIGIAVTVLAPIAGLGGALFLWFWGTGPALIASGFVAGVSWLLLEAFFWNHRKPPFACSYLPGKAKLHVFFTIYFMAIHFYAIGLSSLGKALILRQTWALVSAAAAVSLLAGIAILKKRLTDRGPGLIYSEEPRPAVMSLAQDRH